MMSWPRNDADLGMCDHWVPLIRTGESATVEPHAPCGGSRCCAGPNTCDSELRSDAAACGLQVWPVPADGDCFWHALCVGTGKSSSKSAIRAYRKDVSAWLDAKKDFPAWQRAIVLSGDKGLADEVPEPLPLADDPSEAGGRGCGPELAPILLPGAPPLSPPEGTPAEDTKLSPLVRIIYDK